MTAVWLYASTNRCSVSLHTFSSRLIWGPCDLWPLKSNQFIFESKRQLVKIYENRRFPKRQTWVIMFKRPKTCVLRPLWPWPPKSYPRVFVNIHLKALQREERERLTSCCHAAPHRGVRSFLPFFGQLHLDLRLDFLPVHLNLAETQGDKRKWATPLCFDEYGTDHAKQLTWPNDNIRQGSSWRAVS